MIERENKIERENIQRVLIVCIYMEQSALHQRYEKHNENSTAKSHQSDLCITLVFFLPLKHGLAIWPKQVCADETWSFSFWTYRE